MPTDVLKHAPAVLRSNLPWILFLGAVALQGAAMRIVVHRARITSSMPPLVEPDIVASESISAPMEELPGLPVMTEPIVGAHVPTDPSRLPGAVRGYRGGVHEGVDFSCAPGEPVVAAADGWVLSIDDEPNLPEPRRNELLSVCRELGETPPEVLRVLHGRRITLRHESSDGHLLTSSYSHLASIREDLRPGAHVFRGEQVGTAGSSGTSHAYRHDGWGEVHFEVRIDGHPLGLGGPPRQARALYCKCLGEEVR